MVDDIDSVNSAAGAAVKSAAGAAGSAFAGAVVAFVGRFRVSAPVGLGAAGAALAFALSEQRSTQTGGFRARSE